MKKTSKRKATASEDYPCESYSLQMAHPHCRNKQDTQGELMKKTTKKAASKPIGKNPEPKKLYLAICQDCTWKANGVEKQIAITRAMKHDYGHKVVLYRLATEVEQFTTPVKDNR